MARSDWKQYYAPVNENMQFATGSVMLFADRDLAIKHGRDCAETNFLGAFVGLWVIRGKTPFIQRFMAENSWRDYHLRAE